MKSVARLVYAYFTCTAYAKWLSLTGFFSLIVLGVVIANVPYTSAAWSMLAVVIAWSAVFLGSMFMPLMIERLVHGHSAGILPRGRAALYWSAFISVLLVSIPIPFLSVLAEIGMWRESVRSAPPVDSLRRAMGLGIYFWMYFAPMFFLCSWLYVAVWSFVRNRSLVSAIFGLLVLVVVVYIPSVRIANSDAASLWVTVECVLTWLVFAAYFFLLPRFSHTAVAARLRARMKSMQVALRLESGRELDVMLGTSSPWIMSTAIIVPALMAIVFAKFSLSAWLLMMTINAAVAGGIAATAAARSRAIWLRTRWTREELFAQVERRYWRHNGLTLVVLIALLVGIGLYKGLPSELVTRGVPLLALGMILTTYLALMQTQSLRLFDAVLGISTMVSLMLVAVLAADGDARVPAIELALALVALALRFVAKARWSGLDWRLCLREKGTAARSPA